MQQDEIKTILDSIADGVFTVDENWQVTSFNRAAEKITGIASEDAIGHSCREVFRASICESACALKKTLETDNNIINKAVYIINAKGQRIPVSISTAVLKNKKGKVFGGVETFRDLSIVEALKKKLYNQYFFEDIISKNHEMQKIFDILPDIAISDSTVLIEGESGTGKELVARAIHNLSNRSKKPMVAVNCGALPDTLLESELFGHKAGAFTDAKKDKPGRFALAEGGTIFLDEIGDVSPALQMRLLRVLQEKTYEPLGGVRPSRANVRVIAATNKNLTTLIENKSFRQDLYYRINIIKLSLPPLRRRKEDISLLVEHFITRFRKLKNKEIFGISTDALAILVKHDFPGNIRELENIIEHAFVLCHGDEINAEDLPDNIRQKESAYPLSAKMNLKELEASFIYETIKRNDWNRIAAAKELGIHKSTLFNKIKSLGIKLPKQDGRYKSK